MKKLKLLTSLSLIGSIGTTMPIVAVACDDDEEKPTPGPEPVVEKSYAICDGEKVYWENPLTQQDVDNLAIRGSSTITINGVEYDKLRVTELCINETADVTIIPDYFLNGCLNLNVLKLDGADKITKIGNSFLVGCSEITNLSLPPSEELTTIGVDFLTRCDGLTSLTLPSWPKIETIHTFFLYCCDNLTQLNMGNIPASVIKESYKSFPTDDKTAPMYDPGITLTATDKDNYLTKFGPVSSYPAYRNLK
mgnify:FL=1